MFSASKIRLKLSAIPDLNILKTSTDTAEGETNKGNMNTTQEDESLEVKVVSNQEQLEFLEEGVGKIQSAELLEIFEADEPLSEIIQVGESIEAKTSYREHKATQTNIKETAEVFQLRKECKNLKKEIEI